MNKGIDKIMPFFTQITKNEAKFCEKIIWGNFFRENVKKISSRDSSLFDFYH